jgi:hypothetical protein
MSKNLVVRPTKNGRWEARKEGNERASIVAFTQAEVVKKARALAKAEGSEVVVKGSAPRKPAKRTQKKTAKRA